MNKILYKIFDCYLFHKIFDGLRWYGELLYKLSKRRNNTI